MGPKKVTNPDLSQIYTLVDEIKKDLATKATESGLKELLKAIEERDLKIEMLESKVAVMENTINRLSANVESNEQYSRRTSLRILNIPLPAGEEEEVSDKDAEDETAEDCLRKVKDFIRDTGLEIPDCCIDRAHRV